MIDKTKGFGEGGRYRHCVGWPCMTLVINRLFISSFSTVKSRITTNDSIRDDFYEAINDSWNN